MWAEGVTLDGSTSNVYCRGGGGVRGCAKVVAMEGGGRVSVYVAY